MTKLILRLKKALKRSMKFAARSRIVVRASKMAGMEAAEAIRLGAKFLYTQVKIRPRLRLIFKFIVVLVTLFGTSSMAVANLAPKKAEIYKAMGSSPEAAGLADLELAIRVAEHSEGNIPESDLEISQAVGSKRSPFEFQKPVDGYISQGYRGYHRALDIATDLYSSIHPLGAGVVEFTGRVSDGKGNIVIVDHGDGLKSLYAHMGRIDVGVGNAVDTDSTLGTVGMTGRTTGPHVHLEIYDNGVQVNPASILPE